jgi:tetratricopeptide (TPR) repeat protein
MQPFTRLFRHTAVFVVLTFVVSPLTACINLYYTDLEGHSHVGSSPYSLFYSKVYEPRWQKLHDKLKAELETDGDYKKQSDFAAALMHLGQAQEAIRILVELEKQHPGEYEIAGNLGTAYELVGDLDQAIHWIEIGIERNPDSHGGSEWLHIKILEAKKQLADDPGWLSSHSVVDLEFGKNDAPMMPAVFAEGRTAEDVIGAIDHQLYERLQFVESPDPIVADLLITFGNLVALTRYVEHAIDAYELAIQFQPQNLDLARVRLAHFQKITAGNPNSETIASGGKMTLKWATAAVIKLVTVAVIISTLFVFSGVLLWVVLRRKTQMTDPPKK